MIVINDSTYVKIIDVHTVTSEPYRNFNRHLITNQKNIDSNYIYKKLFITLLTLI